MPLIEWNDSLSVGVSEMDAQHRRWVDIINRLDESLTRSAGKGVLEKVVAEMENYVTYHFSEEEQLMERVGYPELEDHRRLHDLFKADVMRLKMEILSDQIVLRTQIMSILCNWLREHIMNEDRRYSKFISPYF